MKLGDLNHKAGDLKRKNPCEVLACFWGEDLAPTRISDTHESWSGLSPRIWVLILNSNEGFLAGKGNERREAKKGQSSECTPLIFTITQILGSYNKLLCMWASCLVSTPKESKFCRTRECDLYFIGIGWIYRRHAINYCNYFVAKKISKLPPTLCSLSSSLKSHEPEKIPLLSFLFKYLTLFLNSYNF